MNNEFPFATPPTGHFPRNVIAAVSTKSFGNMSASRGDRDDAIKNIAAFCHRLEIQLSHDALVFPNLTHSSNVALLERGAELTGIHGLNQNSPQVSRLLRRPGIDPPKDFIPNPELGIDACITQEPGVFLAMLPADCAPVMLSHKHSGTIALAHVGVLGAFSGILLNTIEALREWCGVPASELSCYIGPCVTQRAYTLTKSGLWEAVLRDHVSESEAVAFDMPTYITQQLVSAGVPDSSIAASNLCTASLPDQFFSNYVAQGPDEKNRQGRHIAILGKH